LLLVDGDHRRHLECLFSRHPTSCRGWVSNVVLLHADHLLRRPARDCRPGVADAPKPCRRLPEIDPRTSPHRSRAIPLHLFAGIRYSCRRDGAGGLSAGPAPEAPDLPTLTPTPNRSTPIAAWRACEPASGPGISHGPNRPRRRLTLLPRPAEAPGDVQRILDPPILPPFGEPVPRSPRSGPC